MIPMNCLYVEDDPLSRDVMRMMVKKVPRIAHITIFEDSADFMTRLCQLNPAPELILLDIHVHPLDGFTMLNLLRAEPRFKNARVIALTASVMNEEVSQLRTSGFDGAIAKPLSLQTFPDLITKVMNGDSVWHII